MNPQTKEVLAEWRAYLGAIEALMSTPEAVPFDISSTYGISPRLVQARNTYPSVTIDQRAAFMARVGGDWKADKEIGGLAMETENPTFPGLSGVTFCLHMEETQPEISL